MQKRIDNLLTEVGQQMQARLANRDFDSVTTISKLLSRIQQLQKRAIELETDVSETEGILTDLNIKSVLAQKSEALEEISNTKRGEDDVRRADQKTLRIEVDWQANGKSHERETICYPKAGDVMVKFLSQVVSLFGQDTLQKLTRIRINRGPLLSKTPTVDFLIKAQGKPYGHKRLSGTDYFVLTHSPTAQKAQDLERVCRILGLVPGSVSIREISKSDYYADAFCGI